MLQVNNKTCCNIAKLTTNCSKSKSHYYTDVQY